MAIYTYFEKWPKIIAFETGKKRVKGAACIDDMTFWCIQMIKKEKETNAKKRVLCTLYRAVRLVFLICLDSAWKWFLIDWCSGPVRSKRPAPVVITLPLFPFYSSVVSFSRYQCDWLGLAIIGRMCCAQPQVITFLSRYPPPNFFDFLALSAVVR